MSQDKYLYIFSRKIEAIVFVILQLFCNARAQMFMNSSLNWIKFETKNFCSGREVYKLGNIAWVIFSGITQF